MSCMEHITEDSCLSFLHVGLIQKVYATLAKTKAVRDCDTSKPNSCAHGTPKQKALISLSLSPACGSQAKVKCETSEKQSHACYMVSNKVGYY